MPAGHGRLGGFCDHPASFIVAQACRGQQLPARASAAMRNTSSCIRSVRRSSAVQNAVAAVRCGYKAHSGRIPRPRQGWSRASLTNCSISAAVRCENGSCVLGIGVSPPMLRREAVSGDASRDGLRHSDPSARKHGDGDRPARWPAGPATLGGSHRRWRGCTRSLPGPKNSKIVKCPMERRDSPGSATKISAKRSRR
jgi:hypothetical protein